MGFDGILRLLRWGALAGLVAAAGPRSTAAAESFAVVSVAEPPVGPDADLAELTHQLRAACRDRIGNVLDVPTMQARLRGQSEGATLSELDRAYGGALAVYQNGEFESALRTLRAIVQDVEALPEGREAYQQWLRAILRLAHAAGTVGRQDEADAALTRLLRIEPGYRADPDQYSPTYRRRMDELRGRLRAAPQRRLTVVANGRAGALFVDGRPSGTTPMTLFLPAARYRIGGVSGALRVPSFEADLTEEDRTVVLDFETAESVRMTAGPGFAVAPGRRAEGIIRAGAWLDVDKVIVASRGMEGGASFLIGSIYDVRRGALLREGSVRTVAGGVPSANMGALAAFLLTGVQQREVRARTPGAPLAEDSAPPPASQAEAIPRVAVAAGVEGEGPAEAPPAAPVPAPDLTPAPPEPSPGGPVGLAPIPPLPREAPPAGAWRRRGAWLSGGVAVGLAALAIDRRLAANDAYASAEALLGPGGIPQSSDLARFRSLTAEGDSATRASWVSAGISAALAVTAGWLGWTAVPPGITAPGY